MDSSFRAEARKTSLMNICGISAKLFAIQFISLLWSAFDKNVRDSKVGHKSPVFSDTMYVAEVKIVHLILPVKAILPTVVHRCSWLKKYVLQQK